MLAALTRAPSAFSPRRDLAGAQDRAANVLRQMQEIGAITPDQVRVALRHAAVAERHALQLREPQPGKVEPAVAEDDIARQVWWRENAGSLCKPTVYPLSTIRFPVAAHFRMIR